MNRARENYIKARLTLFVTQQLEGAVLCVDADHWLNMSQRVARYRYGWLPPALFDGLEDGLVYMLSPQLLAQITAELSDDDVSRYVGVIEMMFAAHTTRYNEDQDRITDETGMQLYRTAYPLWQLWSETEARAIDHGIVPAMP